MGIRSSAHAFDVQQARRATDHLIDVLASDPLGSLTLWAHMPRSDPGDRLHLDLDTAVRDDLRSIDESHVRRFVQSSPRWLHGPDDEREYLTFHLQNARAFVERVAQRGLGLVYTIG